MSCNLITGLPRNGKSYYCTTRIIEDLVSSERTVYTNLPVHPDVLGKIVALRRWDKKSEGYLDILEPTLKRIRIFRTFTSRRDLDDFRKKNPQWCRLHRWRNRSRDKSVVFSDKLLSPMDLLADFWNQTKANSVFYFDECYQIWSCMDASERSSEVKEKRKEIQNYFRMHGHDGDDIYLISHKERDLDKFILDTLSYRINVRNSKYWPIIPEEIIAKYWWMSWLGTLRWPCQFFIIRTFIGDEKTLHRSFFKRCDRQIFKCYDSMSRPNGIKNRGLDMQTFKSSDFKRSYFLELKEWFADAWMALVILSILIFGFIGVIQGIFAMVGYSKSSSVVSSSSAVARSAAVSSTKIYSVVDSRISSDSDFLKVRSVSPASIYFNSGLILKKGGFFDYEGKSWVVLFISRDFLLLECDGRRRAIRTNKIPSDS